MRILGSLSLRYCICILSLLLLVCGLAKPQELPPNVTVLATQDHQAKLKVTVSRILKVWPVQTVLYVFEYGDAAQNQAWQNVLLQRREGYRAMISDVKINAGKLPTGLCWPILTEPDGTQVQLIFLNSSCFTSDDVLAFVFGHELGHFIANTIPPADCRSWLANQFLARGVSDADFAKSVAPLLNGNEEVVADVWGLTLSKQAGYDVNAAAGKVFPDLSAWKYLWQRYSPKLGSIPENIVAKLKCKVGFGCTTAATPHPPDRDRYRNIVKLLALTENGGAFQQRQPATDGQLQFLAFEREPGPPWDASWINGPWWKDYKDHKDGEVVQKGLVDLDKDGHPETIELRATGADAHGRLYVLDSNRNEIWSSPQHGRNDGNAAECPPFFFGVWYMGANDLSVIGDLDGNGATELLSVMRPARPNVSPVWFRVFRWQNNQFIMIRDLAALVESPRGSEKFTWSQSQDAHRWIEKFLSLKGKDRFLVSICETTKAGRFRRRMMGTAVITPDAQGYHIVEWKVPLRRDTRFQDYGDTGRASNDPSPMSKFDRDLLRILQAACASKKLDPKLISNASYSNQQVPGCYPGLLDGDFVYAKATEYEPGMRAHLVFFKGERPSLRTLGYAFFIREGGAWKLDYVDSRISYFKGNSSRKGPPLSQSLIKQFTEGDQVEEALQHYQAVRNEKMTDEERVRAATRMVALVRTALKQVDQQNGIDYIEYRRDDPLAQQREFRNLRSWALTPWQPDRIFYNRASEKNEELLVVEHMGDQYRMIRVSFTRNVSHITYIEIVDCHGGRFGTGEPLRRKDIDGFIQGFSGVKILLKEKI